jgi:cytochrome c oxidase subunit 1
MIGAAGAVAYWFPKMTARMLNERVGKVAFWMIAIGIQVTYYGQFLEGFQGMPRRVVNYAPIFQNANQISTGGAYLLMAGWIVFLYAIVSSWMHGEAAPANPWHAKSLEWMVPTPVPLENFLVDPIVTSDPYGYGEGGDSEPESSGNASDLEPTGPSTNMGASH